MQQREPHVVVYMEAVFSVSLTIFLLVIFIMTTRQILELRLHETHSVAKTILLA